MVRPREMTHESNFVMHESNFVVHGGSLPPIVVSHRGLLRVPWLFFKIRVPVKIVIVEVKVVHAHRHTIFVHMKFNGRFITK